MNDKIESNSYVLLMRKKEVRLLYPIKNQQTIFVKNC